ncbi:DUF1016 N-terminal domain-containing protein [Dolichospermum planctonicum CS-1226]|uniref:DUF1016 N-terminal domain-containing protein n=1 Tax=Dolichospermum planctonicum CS-1226 TaxID=3021751 RepID=A0ABT5AK11_9CYAN|nr:DUF1016 N-terminal domain-containing protein [Dolichospermum planctonicum]MDB9537058.1 DUF1016 N-terminal domain-containing protein [Dolichospermum planctonicum CS-1226]
MSNPITNKYTNLLMEIKQLIILFQYQALKAVNREMINLYWAIGKMIFNRQQNPNWGR